MTDPLDAVSPLDGRYATRTEPLRDYASEAALIRARVRVEAEYLLALSDTGVFDLSDEDRDRITATYEDFDGDDARLVKQIETKGYGDYPATNHDVKAIEYFLRTRLPQTLHPWIHIALTSEDVTNLAYRLLVRDAFRDVIAPVTHELRETLADLARTHRELPMLARTHGQPATPTTFGKELAVYVDRLDRAHDAADSAVANLAGKLAGASGTYAAHTIAFPEIDWPAFAETFVDHLGLGHAPLATQINPGDDLAALFDAIRGLNRILIDLDRDMWLYISQDYLGQEAPAEETGSSTMPHKINPIDFENAEGNLSKANADLAFLADAITTSRLQRDLTDSTLKRNIGTALAHCLIGYTKTTDGLHSIVPDESTMREDLTAHPEVLAEAIQTVLRREGHADAYEQVKALTRGQRLSLEELHDAITALDLPDPVERELVSLTPDAYTGVAADLVDELSE